MCCRGNDILGPKINLKYPQVPLFVCVHTESFKGLSQFDAKTCENMPRFERTFRELQQEASTMAVHPSPSLSGYLHVWPLSKHTNSYHIRYTRKNQRGTWKSSSPLPFRGSMLVFGEPELPCVAPSEHVLLDLQLGLAFRHQAFFRKPVPSSMIRYWSFTNQIPFYGYLTKNISNKNMHTSWWFQPIWKILAKLDYFPK